MIMCVIALRCMLLYVIICNYILLYVVEYYFLLLHVILVSIVYSRFIVHYLLFIVYHLM